MDFEFLYRRRPSALVQAVRDGNLQSVRDILQSGTFHPNSADHQGVTALHEAAANNQCAIVEELLTDERVNPDAVTHEGHTALTVAVKSNACLELVKHLDYHVKNKSYQALLIDACINASPEVVEYIMSCSKVNVNYDLLMFSQTPLLAALDGGKLKVVELILDAGADVNFRHECYGMPLPYAISEDCDKSVIELLISRGAAVDLPTRMPPLLVALEKERDDVAIAILNRIKVQYDEITALTAAVQYNAPELVRRLLSESPSAVMEASWKNERDSVGVLCAAIYSENDDIISMVLNHQFSQAVLETPIPIRFYHGALSLRYFFMGPLAFLLREKMHRSSTMSNLKKLISLGVSVEPKSSTHFPPLVGLIYSKAFETFHSKVFEKALKLLLNMGVNVDHKTTYLPDALLATIELGNFKLFSELLTRSRYTPCEIARIGLHRYMVVYYFILEHMAGDDDYSSLQKFKEVAAYRKSSGCNSNVPSLAVIARNRVRRYMRVTKTTAEFLEVIDSLDIPETLKDYLRFK